MGLKDVLALAFGTMIGWGWIMMAGKWVADAGVVGAVLAFVIGAILCIFVGMTYAELTPALPLAGGILCFSYRGLGYTASWFTGWMITFAYVGVAAWEGPALMTAIDFIVPIPRVGFLWNVAGFDVYLTWVLGGVIGGVLLTALNLFGASISAVAQTLVTIALAIGGMVFFFGSVAMGSMENMLPIYTGTAGIAAVLLMVPAMFVGFDVIPQTAEEMNIPLRSIAKALIISILLAALWYILMIVGIAMAAPPDYRAASTVPVAEAFGYAMGHPLWGKFMIITAICAILTSWNGFFIGASRVIFAMGRAKMLPKIFGEVHPKYGTPYAAIILVGIISSLSPLLGSKALVWFINASSFGTVVAYLMVSASFLALRKLEPNLPRPYRVKGGMFVGVMAVLVSLFFLSLYLPIGAGALIGPEWTMVLVWAVLGTILAVLTKKSYPNVSLSEREYLMFGQEYARKDRIKDRV